MLGLFRFVLAYFVFLSHFPNNDLKYNLGITAVVIFYFISGYLMMRSYARFKLHSERPIRSFYLDRIIKIFPQYLIILSLTVIAFKFFGASTENTYKGVEFGIDKILFDATLIPVSFSVGSLSEYLGWYSSAPIVPPAWSLSLEFHFYILVPFLFLLNKRAIISIALFSSLLLSISLLSRDPIFEAINLGYRNIASMLVVFLTGMFFSSDNANLKLMSYLIWIYFCAFFMFVLPGLPSWYSFGVQEIVFGIILMLPLFHFVKEHKFKMHFMTKVDRWLGDLSYPLFLCHYLSIYLAQHVFNVSSNAKIYFFIASVVISLLLSLCLAGIQRYLELIRIKTRGFSSMRTDRTFE